MSKNTIYLRVLQDRCESPRQKAILGCQQEGPTPIIHFIPLLMVSSFFYSPVPETESSLTHSFSLYSVAKICLLQVPTIYFNSTLSLYAKIIQFFHFTNIFNTTYCGCCGFFNSMVSASDPMELVLS